MLVSRTGLSPVMVGRGAELARLARTHRSPRSWSSIAAGWPASGSSTLQAALVAQDRRVLVAEDAEAIDDLVRDMVRDMVEVLTSFCARLYPKGRAG